MKSVFEVFSAGLLNISIFVLLITGALEAQEKITFDKSENTRTASVNKQVFHSQYVLEQLNKYDINYYRIELNASNTNTKISGNAVIVSTVVSAMDTLFLELVDSTRSSTYMVIDSVMIDGNKSIFIHRDSLVRIPISLRQPGSRLETSIYYHGNGGPDAISLYSYGQESFVTSWSEPASANIWFPCKQVLEDKADSTEMILTTELSNKAGANGRLSKTIILPDNKVKYIWKSHHPTAYYLISFAVGPYIEYNTYAKNAGSTDSVLVQNYLINSPQLLPLHKAAIEKVKLCIGLYSRLFGAYPYKDEKYGHCVNSWPWGAMENQTMTTIGYEYLDTTANLYAGLAYYFSAPHELAHSWFGDYVTCRTWQDIWLNEGFASYCEYIALQEIDSPANAGKWLAEAKTTVVSKPGGRVYNPGNLSMLDGYRINYKKGALLLHMLRNELNNDSLFFDVMKTYIARYANGTAVGMDFKAILEEKSGKDFTDFFNQWYFGEGYPVFNIRCVQNNDSITITSAETKSILTAPLFKLRYELKIKYYGGDTTITIYQTKETEQFTIPFPKSVTGLVFDPDNRVIAVGYVKVTDMEEKSLAIIERYTLLQNYPNPFNPCTKIEYSLPVKSFVTINIYNQLGERVAQLINQSMEAGIHTAEWNAQGKASGIYYCEMKSGSNRIVRKLVLLK
jgi:aminopeptidase N